MSTATSAIRWGSEFPDMASAMSQLTVTEQDASFLTDTFGPGRAEVEMPLGVPVTAATLKDKFTGVNPLITRKFKAQIEAWDGWEPAIAPLAQSEMTHEVVSTEYPNTIMDHAPEGTAPSLIRTVERKSRFDQQRFSIGRKFHHDWFRTPGGRQDMNLSWMTMVSSANRRLKWTVKAVLINTKTAWSIRNRQGITYHTGILDGTADERRIAFILTSEQEKAIYLLARIADRIASTEGITFDSAVMPEGTLDKLAYSSFETEANRRGEATAQDRLSRGGASMATAIAGKTIYEDRLEHVDNDPNHLFDQLTQVGQFGNMYFVDGSDPSKLLCEPCGQARKMFSIQIPEARVDGWKTKDLKWCHRNSMRYAEDGSLDRKRGQDFLRMLPDLMQATGIKVHNQYLDPYFWKTDAPVGGLDQIPEGAGYRQIEHYGDADPRAWPIQAVRDFGSKAKESMMQDNILSESALAKLTRLQAISAQLNDYDPLDAAVQAFFAAVAMNPENRSISGGYLNANEFGGVWPPVVDANSNYVIGGNVVGTSGGNAGFQAGGGTAVAVGTPIPYGFGAITGLRTLARMFRGGQSRGYDRGMLAEVSDGVDALDRVINWLLAVMPRNLYTRPQNVPVYIRAADPKLNTINSIILSIFQELPHPVMVKTPVDVAGTLSVQRGVGANAAGGADRGVAGNAAILAAMGFTNADPLNANIATLGPALDDIRASRNLSAPVHAALFSSNPAERQRLFDAYKNGLGRTYVDYVKGKQIQQPTPAAGYDEREFAKFAWFFREEVARIHAAGNVDGAVNLMNGILSLALGKPMDVQLTSDYIMALQRGTKSKRGTKRQAFDTAVGADTGGAGYDAQNWLNSRLTIGNGVWRGVAGRLEADSTGAALVAFHNSILRPADPTNTSIALAGELAANPANVLAPGGAVSVQGRNLVEKLKFARAGLSGRGMGILQHAGLLNDGMDSNTARARRSRLREGHVRADLSRRQMEIIDELEGAAATRSSGVVAGEASEDPAGAFVDYVPYEDRYGRPTTEMVQVVNKKFLVWRLSEVEKIQDDVARTAAILQCLSEAHLDNIDGCLDAGLPVFGSSFILFQPWVRVRGASGLWFRSGGFAAQSGARYSNAMLQADGAHKTWLLHMHMWCGAVVTDNRGYLFQHHLDARGYMSGYTDEVWTRPDEFDPNNIDFENSPSMFVMDVGSLSREELPNPCTLSGRYHEGAFSQQFRNSEELFGHGAPLYPSALYYNSVWPFYQIKEVGPRRESFGEERQSLWVNEVCYTNNQRDYNPRLSRHADFIEGTGHLSKFPPPFVATLNGQKRLTETSRIPVSVTF